MAENKKSFVLYADLIKSIEHLTNEEKGILLTHLLEYVNDMKPILTDRLILTAWKPIELQLKRDLSKYKSKIEDKSNAGKLGNLKRWHKDLYDKVNDNELDLLEAINIAESRKVSHTDIVPSQSIANIAVNDNVNDNDNVNVNDNDILLKKETKKLSKPLEVIYPFDSEKFKIAWLEWKSYKSKEHNFKFKSEISEGKTLNALYKDSNNNENIAIQMIENAIIKGWKGLFKLDNQVLQNSSNKSMTDMEHLLSKITL